MPVHQQGAVSQRRRDIFNKTLICNCDSFVNIPYICPVNRITNIQKQWIAGVLAVVLLVITGVKFFHSCDDEAAIADQANIGQVSAKAACSICEFHFAHDADVVIATPFIDVPVFSHPLAVTFYAGHFPTSIGLSFSDRGPPAVS